MKTANKHLGKALIFTLFVLLLACRQAPPLSGFDHEAWLSDPDGCQGKRSLVWENFEQNKNKLLGYDENHLKQLLGMPSSKNLFEKGQKIYSYTISGAENCSEKMPLVTLQLRINVTGKVSEVVVIKG